MMRLNLVLLLLFVLSSSSFAGRDIYLDVGYEAAKLQIWIDQKSVYSGEITKKEAYEGRPENPLIWITGVPDGVHDLKIQFQDTTPEYDKDDPSTYLLKEPGIKILSSLKIYFFNCTQMKTFSDSDTSYYELNRVTQSYKRFETVPLNFKIYSPPAQWHCSSKTPEEAIETAKYLADDHKRTPKLYKYSWSELKGEGNRPVEKTTTLTDEVRTKIVNSAREKMNSGEKIRYSQKERTGPSSFDCSGLVCYIYQKAGVEVKDLTVSNIVSGEKFREISEDQAKPGDLVVHLKKDDKSIKTDHVGIYTGKDGNKNLLEISATTQGGRAEYGIEHPDFKSSVAELKTIYFGKKWRFYQWKN